MTDPAAVPPDAPVAPSAAAAGQGDGGTVDAAGPTGAGMASVRPSLGRRLLHGTWELAKSVQLAILIFLVARAFFFEMFKIPSGSMEGTLQVGDFLIVNKLLYGAEVPILKQRLPAVRVPALGDVVVFQWPEDPTKNFVKRLVGLPADTVEMRAGVLYRNGRAQAERYATHRDHDFDPAAEEFRWQRDFVAPGVDVQRYHPSRNNWGPLVVPAGHYFMLGDNRDNSLDSRYWGFVPDSLVRGSPVLVYYSYSPDSGRAFDWLTRIRWERLGEMIR